ncbi:MAG: hypothetical protein IIT68_00925, partial [Treponema sp.]|nr:hypothetical protein [Treponema sp.]
MKKGRSLLFFVFLVALSAVLFSCSQVGTGSVAFHFDAQFIEQVNRYRQSEPSPIPSRSALDSYINGTTYVEVKLEGDKELSQTYPLTEDLSIEFEGIPVGARIRAVLTLFSQEEPADPDTRSDICTGQSDWTVIASGENVLEITLRGLNYRIFVTFRDDPDIQSGSLMPLDPDREEPQNDGRTPNTGYSYIQSAIDWIAENGNRDEDYEIVLTGFDDTNAFNQRVTFGAVDEGQGDNLTGHAKSITLTSTDASNTALRSDANYIFYVKTEVPVYFKNIKIASSSASTQNGHIINMPESNLVSSKITMGQDATFVGESENNAQYGGAVFLSYGSFTMEDNATISGFNASEGGAVFVNKCTFYMKDSAVITGCSASGNGGGVSVGNARSYQGFSYFYMSDDARIETCSCTGSSSNGGAVAVGKWGRVSISSGTIQDCSKGSGSSAHGDGIALISGDDGGSVSMSGGIMKWTDTTTSNEAVYVPNAAAEFSISGDVSIKAPNVIMVDYNSTLGCVKLDAALNNKYAAIVNVTSSAATRAMSSPIIAAEDNALVERAITGQKLIGYDSYYLKESGCTASSSAYKIATVDQTDPEKMIAVGDIVFANDNSRARPANATYLTYMDRQRVAGIIFYTGTSGDLLGEVNLMVGTEMYNDNFARGIQSSMAAFDATTRITNFQQVYDVSWRDSTSATVLYTDAQISNAQLGSAYLTSQSSLISEIINGTNTNYPLLNTVLHHGDKWTGTDYALDTSVVTNNWYIPTIAECIPLCEAFQDSEFREVYETFYRTTVYP